MLVAAALEIDFQIAAAEALPFSGATFDVVLSTTMLHCLPGDARRRSIEEMGRVLKPGARLLIVDFGGSVETRHNLLAHLRHHRHFDVHEVLPALDAAGSEYVESGTLGFSDLQFVLTRKRSTAVR
jgi:ubiquinone/menaquinone biosynthesis C-methylase UbiE